nr:hypothetical protein [uncultured Sphingomonas sp.]
MISLLLALAVPAPVTATVPAPVGPVREAGMTWLKCLETEIKAVPATLAPDAGTEWVLQQCEAAGAPFHRLMEQQIERSSGADRALNWGRYLDQLGRGREWIGSQIAASRAAKPR